MTVHTGKGKAVIKAVAVREAEDDKMLKGANVRQSTEYAYTYFWMSLRGHKKISSKYSLYIEL